MSECVPDYSGWLIERDGVRRPMVLSDELCMLVDKDGNQLSLKGALAYPGYDALVTDCPWLDVDYSSPLRAFLKERLE